MAKETKHISPMSDKQISYLAQHTCQWCQAVLKQGIRFIDSLEMTHGDLPWEEDEHSSMFLADKVFLITAIHHAISNLERFNNELESRNDYSFKQILDAISNKEERKNIRAWRNMNEHDLDYLTGCGNKQEDFITTIEKENYRFVTDAFTTIIHGDASLFSIGNIDIGNLLKSFKNNMPHICEKTEEVFNSTFY